jgi:hypothetical protein
MMEYARKRVEMPQGRRRLLWLRRISITHIPYGIFSAEKTKKGVKKHDSTAERYPLEAFVLSVVLWIAIGK